MANSLILCGGTGAHAALAMMRLHTLGYALGFFRQSNGKPLDFRPSISSIKTPVTAQGTRPRGRWSAGWSKIIRGAGTSARHSDGRTVPF